ncbi:MAG: hypothetical protein Tsb0016_03760 [Sphingomonadales bacterium]
MSNHRPDHDADAVSDTMMLDVLETVEDRLDTLAAILADARTAPQARQDTLRAFIGTIHSLKGLVRAFGLHGLAALCHRLEDRLAGQTAFNDALLALTGDVVQRLRDLAQDGLLHDPRLIDQICDRLDRAA